MVSCFAPIDHVATNTDCNDQLIDVNPNSNEYYDGIDNNCDGLIDEATALDASLWYRDLDNDGFGNPTDFQSNCNQPAGYIEDSTDCNDNNSLIHPSAIETCNSVDDNCDGTVDASDAIGQTTYYLDADMDGYGDENYMALSYGSQTMCASQYDPTDGYVLNFDDCDDSDATVNPDKYWYVDSDLDGFGNDAINFQSCEAPFGYIEQNGDCDDTQSIVFPATELCNGILDNCNTTTGLMNGIPSNEYDADLDGFVEAVLMLPPTSLFRRLLIPHTLFWVEMIVMIQTNSPTLMHLNCVMEPMKTAMTQTMMNSVSPVLNRMMMGISM